MREISFVKRLKFNFNGSVTKKALVIGDADNDQHNELVCANLQGELAIFKDRNPNRYAYATDLGMVTACVIGDVINGGMNYVAAINTEGWLFIFNVPNHQTTAANSTVFRADNSSSDELIANDKQAKGCGDSLSSDETTSNKMKSSFAPAIKLKALYDQRMPANCKELLLADLDGDGHNEVIVGLTDRVLRTYKWIKIGPDRGKFVGLYKWEFADQIGAVSLNPSRHENCQDIIVAQPGGTYAKLECFDKKSTIPSNQSTTSSSSDQYSDEISMLQQQQQQKSNQTADDGNSNNDDNVRTEFISKLTPEYHQLDLAKMRNHHISTEVLGGIRDGKNSKSYSLIVIATLDGTLMLVNKDEILWSLQVDHQLFALAILESNRINESGRSQLSQSESTCTIVPNDNDLAQQSISNRISDKNESNTNLKSQYFVVCAWNGKTYIIDEERNYLRFKFDEAVSAFTAGNYYFDDKDHASLVYATFNNQIVLYYDVLLEHIRPLYLLEEIIHNPENLDLLEKLEILSEKLKVSKVDDGISTEARIHDLLQDLLYGITDNEIS